MNKQINRSIGKRSKSRSRWRKSSSPTQKSLTIKRWCKCVIPCSSKAKKTRREAFFPGSRSTSTQKDVQKCIQTCVQCQQSKVHHHTQAAPGNLKTPRSSLSTYSHPPSNGYLYLLTYVDRFIRWPQTAPQKPLFIHLSVIPLADINLRCSRNINN